MSFSNMIKGFVNGEEIAYVKNGLVLKGVTMQVMVGSEDDLVNLPEDIMPGSVAFTAGYGSMWQKAADGSWEEISQEGGGGGGAPLVIVVGETTWQEVHDAMAAGVPVVYSYEDTSVGAPEGNIMTEFMGYAFPSNGSYVVVMYGAAATDDPRFVAESADGALSLYGG